MEPKYNIGDRVTVVHRMSGDYYYSYSLEGSTGTIDQIRQHGDEYIYHLDHDDVVIAHPEAHTEQQYVDDTPERAWYNERCLDPAPELNVVGLEDFEVILN